MRYLIFFSLLLLAGCIPTKTMVPSSTGGSFVLTEDIYDYTTRGLDYLWLEGLTRGEYIAVGHDENGIYYRGPYRCQIRLDKTRAERFLATGERPIATADPEIIEVWYGDEGGVYVPYDLENEKPEYFFYGDYRHATGELDSKIPARPASQINAVVEAPKPAEAVYSVPNVTVIDPQNPSGIPTPEAALGASIGVAVGRQLGLAAFRNAQGEIMPSMDVRNERILAIIRAARTGKQ